MVVRRQTPVGGLLTPGRGACVGMDTGPRTGLFVIGGGRVPGFILTRGACVGMDTGPRTGLFVIGGGRVPGFILTRGACVGMDTGPRTGLFVIGGGKVPGGMKGGIVSIGRTHVPVVKSLKHGDAQLHVPALHVEVGHLYTILPGELL
jgi:hypothetical protein